MIQPGTDAFSATSQTTPWCWYHPTYGLVDTGAEIRVVPRNMATRKVKKQSQRLQAANGSTVPTFGEVSLSMDFGLRRTFCWIFTVAAVAIPILGADFLRDNGLLVDLPRHQLCDANTDLTVTSLPCEYEVSKLHALSISKENASAAVLTEFPELIQPIYNSAPPKHRVTHHIVTAGPPVHARPRRLAPN